MPPKTLYPEALPNAPLPGTLLPRSFAHRASPASLPEWMDGPCMDEQLRGCLRSLRQVNRLTLSYWPTLAFLDRLVATSRPTKPLHILDVGSGGGDTLRRIARWAARRDVAVRLTGIDLNPSCTRLAREFDDARNTCGATAGTIEWISGDAFTYTPEGGIDVILSSLVTHHMEDAGIVAFLAWMERSARRGWFINDLHRSAGACRGFSLLARLLRWHPFVRHDGPVSFHRAFLPSDWNRLLAAAGIARQTVALENWRPARLCVARLR